MRDCKANYRLCCRQLSPAGTSGHPIGSRPQLPCQIGNAPHGSNVSRGLGPRASGAPRQGGPLTHRDLVGLRAQDVSLSHRARNCRCPLLELHEKRRSHACNSCRRRRHAWPVRRLLRAEATLTPAREPVAASGPPLALPAVGGCARRSGRIRRCARRRERQLQRNWRACDDFMRTAPNFGGAWPPAQARDFVGFMGGPSGRNNPKLR